MTTMKSFFPNEVAFMEDHLAFADSSSLELLNSLDEAQVQIDGMVADYGTDLPEMLKQPEIMLAVFNQVAREEIERSKQMKIQEQDDQIAAMNPDCIRFRKAYEDGSSAFFDPDQLTHDLIRTGYDEVHREIIAKALIAYHKNYQDNL